MEDYTTEILNKNIIQNNIEKLKRSMNRLKLAINRSNSKNYKNFKINSPKNYDIFKNNMNIKEPFNEENKSFLYYNLEVSQSNNNFSKINTPDKNLYIDKKNNNKQISSMFNIYKDEPDFTPIIPSRNNNNMDRVSKTSIILNDKIENSIETTPFITDINSNLYSEKFSFLLDKNNINNKLINNNINEKIIRNKSENQIKILNNLNNQNKSKKNNCNNRDFSDNCNSNKDLYFTNENSLSNVDIFEANNKVNKKNFESYLKNQINLFSKTNKGLLIRYKTILNNFKSANEQNIKLIDKINELKIKDKNINKINKGLEVEYNDFKNKLILLNKDDYNKDKNNENKKLITQQNKDLKEKIEEYDDIILQLKNKIKKIIEEGNKNNKKEKMNKMNSFDGFKNKKNIGMNIQNKEFKHFLMNDKNNIEEILYHYNNNNYNEQSNKEKKEYNKYINELKKVNNKDN